jgi:hypothetical protein
MDDAKTIQKGNSIGGSNKIVPKILWLRFWVVINAKEIVCWWVNVVQLLVLRLMQQHEESDRGMKCHPLR